MKNRKIIFLIILVLGITAPSFAKSVSCLPKAEMGETTEDSHIYERGENVNIKYLSSFDFEKMTVTSNDGSIKKISRVENNLYKTVRSAFTYYFITNDRKTLVTEVTVDGSATYIKVLQCK